MHILIKESMMKTRQVVLHEEVPFRQVDWGLTKDLVGPEQMGAEHIRVKITEYLPGYSHKLHVHPTQEEVIFVLEGRGITETREDKIEIGPGSVAFVPAGVHHATTNLSLTEPLRAVIVKSPPDDKENQADA
jgi:mannose-6-phosphate isomerase-like protein (cupin superfamily)